MSYLLNEKRFHKNSNGFEFHVQYMDKKLVKIWQKLNNILFAVLKGIFVCIVLYTFILLSS